jgi:hypothetical protein
MLAGPAAETQIANPSHAFVAKYARSGRFEWATEYGQSEITRLAALVPRADGSLLASGTASDAAARMAERPDQPFLVQLDARGERRAARNLASAWLGVGDRGRLLAMSPANGQLRFEHHDARGATAAGSVDAPVTGKPLAFARGADGRVAVAIQVGDYVEKQLGGGRVSTSAAALDSVLAIGPALDQLVLDPARRSASRTE